VTSPTPVFCIADPSLRDFVGHHFSYDHAVAEAARGAGFTTLVLGHRSLPADVARQAGAVPCFQDHIWAHRAAGGPILRRGDDLLRNRRFAADLLGALPKDLPPGSVLLAHMLTRRQMLGLARVVEALPRHVTTIALLRYQTQLYDDGLSARAFARLRRAVSAGARLRLASDSARLARRISRLAEMPVEVLPIPHTPPDLPPPAPPEGRALHLVSLGNARDEKGFLDILAAIRLLRAEPAGLEGLRFTLQANDATPDIAAAIEDFAQDLPAQVRLLRQALTPDCYTTLLAASDMVLLPYWRGIYEARTSGVLPEAMGGGRPVICTAATWMADELALYGAGLLVADHDPKGLAAAIRQAHAAWPRLAAGALAGRGAALARHGGQALMRAILAPPPLPPPPEPPRRVQVFYPWSDFLDRKAGASLRSNLMADIIAPHVEELRVLQDGTAPTTRRGNLVVETLQERRMVSQTRIFAWRVLKVLTRPLSGAAHAGEVLFPWLYLTRMVDPFFRRQVRRLVSDADAVILEYGFWAGPVLSACRRLGVPCVLTAHDVIGDRVQGSALLHRLTAWLETRALRQAPHVVAVTADDAAHFAKLGVMAHVVPNPVDLGAMSRPLPAPPRQVLQDLGITLPERPFALFVGSQHPPNVTAVAQLRTLAARLDAELGEAAPLIVVAGSAAEAETLPGFLALGRVPELALAALYQSAHLAVVPLPEGTGSSLKTLEAMAAGLPVLGTRIAFRGLPVTDDAQGVMEDELARWVTLLPALVADPDRRARLAAGGRALAAGYDHRQVMAAYLLLLGIPGDTALPGPHRGRTASAGLQRRNPARKLSGAALPFPDRLDRDRSRSRSKSPEATRRSTTTNAARSGCR